MISTDNKLRYGCKYLSLYELRKYSDLEIPSRQCKKHITVQRCSVISTHHSGLLLAVFPENNIFLFL